TYEEIQKGIQSLQFPRKPAIPKDEQDEEKEALYKKQRDLIKKQLDTICLYFQADASVEVSMINEARSQMQILIDMAYAFYTKAQSNRLSRGRVLFSDISQLAYAILSQDEIKQKWHARIDEVMIDEYQDTTLAQEELFATFGADKLFLVGDMKQAIYRFRQSDPLLFAAKNAYYREENTHTVIDLNQNFRSRSKVLSYINDVFEPLMDEHVGEMIYDNNAKLYFGLTGYKSEDEMIDVLLIDSSDETIEDSNKEQAQVIANQIKRIFTEKMEVFEKGKMRPITFSDIAILTRNNQSDFLDALIGVFQNERIPFQKEGKTKFSEHLEVTWILSMLQALSNPFDDIQFATVLKSPFGDISMQQLYDVSKNEGETLYDKTRISNDPKMQLFFERFDMLRNQVFALAPTKLFRMMLQLFQFEYAIEAMSNQMNRKQNIEILYELTKSIETTRSMTFSEYVYYLVKQVQQDQISINTPQISDTPDAVMIQTFHKSKGLEYPVVFVSNINKNFNLKTDASMYKLKDVGIVRSYHQTSDKKRYQTIESMMCKDQLRHEALSEEMRLFYVALTRAREKLYVTGVMNSKQKEQLPPPIQTIYPYSLRIQAQSMLDWIMLSLHKTRKWANVHYFQKSDIQVDESIMQENKQIVSQQLSKEAIQSLEWKDEDAAYQFIPLKLSVTELKKKVEFTDSVNFIPFKSNTIIKPKLKSTLVNRAMIGTATHTLFEHFDFNAISYEQIQIQIQNLVLKKQIDSEVAKEIAVDKIVNFLQSPLGQMLCINEMNIQREIPFRMFINAAYAGYGQSNAEVLVQGVIDALVVDEASKSVYIVDYKTDDMSFYKTVEKRKAEINNRYRVQADLYKEAIERIYTDYTVIMYFITLDDTRVYEYQNGQFNI
ncbi:MAG: 3'-5' exonuclease, partial [Culicoidibacterales bacterium]